MASQLQALRLSSYIRSAGALRPRLARACASGAGQPAEMDLYKFLEHPDVLVLDVRSREEYDMGHIGMI